MAVQFVAWGYPVTALELAACALLLAGLIAAVAGSRWTWPLLLSAIGCWGWLYLRFGLLGSVLVEALALIVGLFGLRAWLRREPRQPRRMTWRARLLTLGAAVAACYWGAPWLLAIGAAATTPDALIEICTLVALLLLAGRRIETWVAWGGVGLLGAVHFAAQDLWFSALAAAAALVLALAGWFVWSVGSRAPADSSEPVPVTA